MKFKVKESNNSTVISKQYEVKESDNSTVITNQYILWNLPLRLVEGAISETGLARALGVPGTVGK